MKEKGKKQFVAQADRSHHFVELLTKQESVTDVSNRGQTAGTRIYQSLNLSWKFS